MARKKYGPEQVIRMLREAEVELAKGSKVPAVCKKLGITPNTYYRWRKEYGGLKVDQAKRLKELERENARLKNNIFCWSDLLGPLWRPTNSFCVLRL